MEYPDWAPNTLVDLHKELADPDPSESAHRRLDQESLLADILQNADGPVSEDNVESLRQQIYRMIVFGPLPENERLLLLEKFITEENMKAVWVTLSKRFKDDFKDPRQFFHACQRGITGWRGDPKQTPAERRASYQEIFDTVAKLDSLLNRSSGLDFYSITELIKGDSIEWLADVLDVPPTYASDAGKAESYVRFCLSDVMPSIHVVLSDIGEKAVALRDAPTPVKKPNSQNAEVHYFIRWLSDYCQRAFGQPLHKVVAVTASVIFDLPNCDESYVRKIVKV